MMKISLYLACFVLALQLPMYGQQKFARNIVDTLASPNMYGRGYVKNGDKLAAKYISDAFKSFGLKNYGENYYQEFKIGVNTFPDSMSVSLDGKHLIPGVDYIVNANSGSAKGSFKPISIGLDNWQKEVSSLKENGGAKGKIAVLHPDKYSDKDTIQLFNELRYFFSEYMPVIIVTQKKFTWTVGRKELKNPIILVHDSLDFDAVQLNIHNVYFPDYKTQNVIGFVEGRNTKKKIVISAHYDHLGMMGDQAVFTGANDNSSGVAMLLYLAKYFSEHQPKYTLVLMAFSAEEAGLVGSQFYTEHPLFPLDEIKFLINCDLAGTGDEGITVVNGTVYKKQFKKLAKINVKKHYLTKVKVRGRAANSDHYWFSQKGVPAIFIYTMGGISAYHDVYDKAETLPLTEFDDYSQLLIDFIGKL